MSWRTVVLSSSAKLDYQLGYLVIRKEDTCRIHISEISMLIIESTSVSLTAALLNELTKKKVKVIFCDEKRNPSSELIPFYGSHDTSAKIREQIKWTDEQKADVWKKIVAEKIGKQAEVLREYGKKEADLLESYINEIEYDDATNREGHAAKVYFNALFGMDFSRTANNSINAALNYGYGIIVSAFSREIVSNGYLTQIGISHSNMFNQFNLSSDLMEPFRPIIDRRVKEMSPQKFESLEKREVLSVLNDDVFIAGRSENIMNTIKIYCKSVFDAINSNDTSMIKFYEYEL